MKTRSTLLVGGLFALAGFLVGLWVRAIAPADDYDLFPLAAAFGALAVGMGLWWAIVARRGRYSGRRGALAGGLAGLLAHPLCWYALIVAQNVAYLGWGGGLSSLGEPPVDLLNGVLAAGLFSLGSLLFFGWLTIPLGAIIGGVVGRRLGRVPSPAAALPH